VNRPTAASPYSSRVAASSAEVAGGTRRVRVRCGQADFAHLTENLLRPELGTPSRDLAQTHTKSVLRNAIHDRTSSI